MQRVGVVVGGVMCVVLAGCASNPVPEACAQRAPGELVITEVMADPAGADPGGEWVEVYNGLAEAVDLTGLELYVQDVDGSGARSLVLRGGTAPAQGFVALGDARAGATPSWLGYSYGDGLGALGNARGVVGLRCGATVLDEVMWTSPATPGRSRMLGADGLAPSASLNDDELRWCAAPAEVTYTAGNAGTPGQPNPSCQVTLAPGSCLAQGVARPIVAPRPGQLRLSEVLANPSGAEASAEWVELVASADVDLNGVTLANGAGASHTFEARECLRVAAGQYVTLARSADTALNGQLPLPLTLSPVSLSNGPEHLVLRRQDAGLDEALLPPSSVGRAWQVDPARASGPSDDPARWCPAPARWVPDAGDYGSPGAPNPRCDAAAPPLCEGHFPGELVFTELMLDPDGVDTGQEWLELYNPTPTPVDVSGLILFARDSSGVERRHQLVGGQVPAHGFYVVGDARGPVYPAWLDASYGADLGALPNTSGRVGLRCGATVLDEVSWAAAARSGRARMLNGGLEPTALANDAEAAWCDAPQGEVYFTPNAGTPGQANPACVPEALAGTCLERGALRPVVQPGPGQLVITEVMANPSGSQSTAEWFELRASAAVDLNGLTVANASGTSSSTITAQDCLRVQPGETVVLARSLDPFVNGGLPPPRAQYSLALANGPERLVLRRGDAGIDQVAFEASSSGVAWQLDPRLGDANDAPSAFCPAPRAWGADGGDRGSPGEPNPPCPGSGAAPTPSSCRAPDGATRPVVAAEAGDLLITEVMANPAGASDATGEYLEVLVTRPVDLNGVALSDGSGSAVVFTAPTCLEARAGAYLVFAKSADAGVNGGLGRVDQTFPFELNNGGDVVRLRGLDGGLLDELAYAAAQVRSGVAWQLRPALFSPLDNDHPGNGCFTPDAGGARLADGDLGTPGRENPPCP